jgi:type II secretory pathway pseudopilin PulG
MSNRTHARAGFTIVEMLVAVAAVTLIALGVAQVFTATGETVRVGRRISSLNERAATIERQMREDFARMTRRGFLVIRNQEVYSQEPGDATTGGQLRPGPKLSASDNRPREFRRARRIDEIVFFAEGQYESLRERVDSGRRASSNAARIYYGHGLRQNPSAPSNAFYEPRLNDQLPGSGASGVFFGAFSPANSNNPNRFAGSWTLLRHATVLATPTGSPPPPLPPALSTLPPDFPTGVRRDDNAWQIALQPSVPSIFRLLSGRSQRVTSAGQEEIATSTGGHPDLQSTRTPRFSSGLVDLATTDLTEIRSTVLSAGDLNEVAAAQYFSKWLQAEFPGGVASFEREDATGPDPAGVDGPTSFMKRWMVEAMPTATDPRTGSIGTRIRYEPLPPDPIGINRAANQGVPFNDTFTENLYRRIDQAMLPASNFVPSCTEFIVEWSFGQRVPAGGANAGALIWHGLPRRPFIGLPPPVAAGGNPVLPGASALDVRPYRNDDTGATADTHWYRYRLRSGAVTVPGGGAHRVKANLIHWVPSGAVNIPDVDWSAGQTLPGGWPTAGAFHASVPLYSIFGYVDPTYPAPSAGSDSPVTIPWAWPKLIRVTMSLVDPTDPTTEETFQFVFEVPSESAN